VSDDGVTVRFTANVYLEPAEPRLVITTEGTMSDEQATEKRFTTIRSFIEEAISGKHTKEEVIQVLENIEAGIGIEEHDRVLAEKFQHMPESDQVDPVWLKGFDEGYRQGVKDQRKRRKGARIKKLARKARAN
jgi:hypothetical protein